MASSEENATPVTADRTPPIQQSGSEPAQGLAPWAGGGEDREYVFSTLSPKETLVAINDTLEITELKDKPAKIVHVTVHSASLRDDVTGEVSQVRRTVLTDVKGVNYACVSEGVIQSIQQISGVYGQPPWTEEPIALRLIEKQTRKGYRVYRLIPA